MSHKIRLEACKKGQVRHVPSSLGLDQAKKAEIEVLYDAQLELCQEFDAILTFPHKLQLPFPLV